MESEQIKDLMGIHLVRYFVNKYMNKQKNYRDQTTKTLPRYKDRIYTLVNAPLTRG